VANGECKPCDPGTTKDGGDDASLGDTFCQATRCPPNYKVKGNKCIPCPAGETRASGDDASKGDTTCAAVPRGPPGGRTSILVFKFDFGVDFQSIVSYVQANLGFSLGSVPTSAPQVTESQVVQYGTTMMVGTWISTSFVMPRVTVGNQEYEITDWGAGVERATIIVHDHADAPNTVGVALNPPSSFHSIASQVVSVTRWDAAGNKITAGAMKFLLCLESTYTGAVPGFWRYPDGSPDGTNLVNEGGSVVSNGSNCFDVTTTRTSSIAGFNISDSPSPSTATSSSPSPSPTSSSSSSDGAWFGLLALLVIPIGAVIAVAYLAYGKKTTETAYMVSPRGSSPIIAQPGPNAGPPPSPVVPFYSSV